MQMGQEFGARLLFRSGVLFFVLAVVNVVANWNLVALFSALYVFAGIAAIQAARGKIAATGLLQSLGAVAVFVVTANVVIAAAGLGVLFILALVVICLPAPVMLIVGAAKAAGEKVAEAIMAKVFLVCACVSILALLVIAGFLLAGGLPAIVEIGVFDFLWGTRWAPLDADPQFGIRPMIIGTLYTTGGAMLLGVPIGIFTAIFLAYICPKPMRAVLKPAVNLLAGIPSIVYGFFGMIVLAQVVRGLNLQLFGVNTGFTILTASLLLSVMILPTIIAISEGAIRAVSHSYYEGAVALGASRVRAVFAVIVPAARSGIFASVVLGIGRAIGETMAVVMVIGNQAVVPDFPLGYFRGGRTLTANIVLEMGYATGLHRDALVATGVVLIGFILLINIALNVLNRRKG